MNSPFKFLDSYTKDDRNIFFGRDRETEELYQKVFDGKILLVYGISGSGKSSLIHCGLANKFRETDWLPLVVRRGANIIESMAAEIENASITPQKTKFNNPADFKKCIRSLYLDHYKPVYFIFDQFEELFIFGDKEERKLFIQIVKSIIESDLQIRFIFVMREEYMASITEFEKFIPAFLANRVRIEKMSHTSALDVITEPCKVFNINLEEGFAEFLLEKLSPREADVELTYLQVYLDKIFRMAVNENTLHSDEKQLSFSLLLLNKTGNVSDLLGSFLDEQISNMDDPDTAMTVLKAFVSEKGTKRPASETETIENVLSLGKEVSAQKIKELLQTFVRLRVLRDKDDHGRYELRHDALAEKIFEKFTLAEKELLELRQFIENAYQNYLKRKVLLNNDDLQFIANKDSQINLNSDLHNFIQESRKHQKDKSKDIKRLTVISTIAFILLLSTIGYTLSRTTKKSESILYSKQSTTEFTRPIDRLALAGEAWESYKGEEAAEALLKAFNNLIRFPGTDKNLIKLREEYLIEFKPSASIIQFAQCSRDNQFIYGFSADSIYLWNKNGNLFSGFNRGNSPLISLLMSNDGKYLGAVNIDSTLIIWDNKGKIQFTYKTAYNSVNRDQIFRFTKNNRILVISNNKDADLLDINGNCIQSFDLHKARVNSVSISDDGKFIATASSDKTINVWYLNSDQQRFDLYNIITSSTDTVWSIDFANNSRYLLSTSADGRVLVTSINNEMVSDVNDRFDSDDMNKGSSGHPYFSEFDESGTGIIISSSNHKYNRDTDFMMAMYVDINYSLAQAGEICRFDYIRFSPYKKYLVYVAGDDVSLISRTIFLNKPYGLFNCYRLLQINGKKPFFSTDGKYIFTICGNHLESWFIDIDTIAGIAVDYYHNWYKYLY